MIILQLTDGRQPKSNIMRFAEKVKIEGSSMNYVNYDIDVDKSGKEDKLTIKSIEGRMKENEETTEPPCESVISAPSDMIDQTCSSKIPRIKNEQILSIMVDGNGDNSWLEKFINNKGSYTNQPPPDLSSISKQTPHYFHQSIESQIYDRILFQIYDGPKVMIEISFEINDAPRTFYWFSTVKIKYIKVYDPVKQSVVEAIRDSSLFLKRDFKITPIWDGLITILACEKKYIVNYSFVVFINCIDIPGLLCRNRNFPVITYQKAGNEETNDMSYATHIVIRGLQFN